jgi:hypothetical protein
MTHRPQQKDKNGREIQIGDVLRCRLFHRDSGTSDFLVEKGKNGELEINGYPINLYDEVIKI